MTGGRLREEGALFLLAIAFMTRLPVGARVRWTPERAARVPRWYPGAGIVVGAVAGGVFAGAALVWPPAVAALLAVAAGIVVTGGLHEDGLADLCDGLGGGADAERALAIMRDSRIGAFGALGLIVVIGLKVAALAALPVAAVPLALVAAHGASRAVPVAMIAAGRYVRPEGAAAAVAGGRRCVPPALALAGAAILPLALVLPPLAVAAGIALLGVCGWAVRRIVERRLGGYTGDCLGAAQQVAETGFYLGLLAWI